MYIVKSIVLQSNAFVISHVKPKSEYGMFKILSSAYRVCS